MNDKQLMTRAVLRLLTALAISYGLITPEGAQIITDPEVVALVALSLAELWFWGQKFARKRGWIE